LLVINYYNNFTDLLYLIQPMKLFRQRWTVFALFFLISVVFPSCSSHSREAICKGSNTYKGYNPKKNKSRYNQKYIYKNRSVRKDYVIKNGIAR